MKQSYFAACYSLVSEDLFKLKVVDGFWCSHHFKYRFSSILLGQRLLYQNSMREFSKTGNTALLLETWFWAVSDLSCNVSMAIRLCSDSQVFFNNLSNAMPTESHSLTSSLPVSIITALSSPSWDTRWVGVENSAAQLYDPNCSRAAILKTWDEKQNSLRFQPMMAADF